MQKSKHFLYTLNVKNNMAPSIGTEKAKGLILYEKAVYTPTRTIVESIKSQYGPNTRVYFSKFTDEVLYRSYSFICDLMTTIQGSESQIRASLANYTCNVEPHRMLGKVVDMQICRFLEKQNEATKFDGPVPPSI